jgi:hypothetical protein
MLTQRTFLLIAALAFPAAADAQRYPTRDHGDSSTQRRDRSDAKPDSKAVPYDAFSAMERELPSLKTDLALRESQLNAWAVFERDVRDVAEMDRTRRKHLMALRESGEKPPTAVTVIATLAEDDRLRSEATADLKRHFDTLYALLDEGQRRTVDKRVVLSQTDPLGR